MGFARTRPLKGLGGRSAPPPPPAAGTATVEADRSITYTRPNTTWASELLVDGVPAGQFGLGQATCVAFPAAGDTPVGEGTATVNADRSITYTRPNTTWASELLVDGVPTGRFEVGQGTRVAFPAQSSGDAYSGFEGAAELPRAYFDTTYAEPARQIVLADQGSGAANWNALQSAVNTAAAHTDNAGTTIVLRAGADYHGGQIHFPVQASSAGWIYLRSSGIAALPPASSGTGYGTRAANRVSPAHVQHMPRILCGQTNLPPFTSEVAARRYRFTGLNFEMATGISGLVGGFIYMAPSTRTGVASFPGDIVVDRCRFSGSDTQVVRRAILVNGSIAVVDSYIENIHDNDSDSQAILVIEGPGPFKFTNNFLEAAGENILFGGGGTLSAATVPHDIWVAGNHFYKDPEWRGVWVVKNLYEMKTGRRCLLENNLFENVWPSGQDVAIILKTVDQDRNNPDVVTEDVVVRNNWIRRACTGFQVAYDPENTSNLGTQRVRFRNNLVTETGYWGDGVKRTMQGHVPSLEVIHNTCISVGAAFLFDQEVGVQYGGFVMRDNVLYSSAWHPVNSSAGNGVDAITAFVSGPYTYTHNLMGLDFQNINKSPPPNLEKDTLAEFGFVNFAGEDYRLAAGSPGKAAATDGKDLGADIDLIMTKLSGVN